MCEASADAGTKAVAKTRWVNQGDANASASTRKRVISVFLVLASWHTV